VKQAGLAFLRRRSTDNKEQAATQFGPFELDAAAHKLFYTGVEVILMTKEFRLLEYFVARQGRIAYAGQHTSQSLG